jgi:hypothetical protein
MRFELMRPGQLRAAIDAGTPFVLPIGVMEYHAGHLPAGVDLLAVTETLARLGDEIVVMPSFAYGAASHAVAGPEGTGNLHIDTKAIVPMAEALFTALLRGGFRDIHGVIHHQTENFDQGMPTDLAFGWRRATRSSRSSRPSKAPAGGATERGRTTTPRTRPATAPSTGSTSIRSFHLAPTTPSTTPARARPASCRRSCPTRSI